MTIAGAAILTIIRAIVMKVTYPKYYLIAKEMNDEDERKRYAHKAADKTYRTAYFICSSLWGWYVLKDTNILPGFLGGMAGGDYKNVNMESIYTDYPYALIPYSFWTFGYHLQDFFQHAFLDERHNDFNEMLIHHIAAVSLYFCYTMGNMVPIGSCIAFLHDLADIPGSLCKLLNATHYQDSSAVVFVMCMCVWFYTRILCLPGMIYFIFQQQYKGVLD